MDTNWEGLGDNELIVKLKSDYIQLHANGLLDFDQFNRILIRSRDLIQDSKNKKVLIIAYTQHMVLHHDIEGFITMIDRFPTDPNIRFAWVEMNCEMYTDQIHLEAALIEAGYSVRLFYDEQHALRWLLQD